MHAGSAPAIAQFILLTKWRFMVLTLTGRVAHLRGTLMHHCDHRCPVAFQRCGIADQKDAFHRVKDIPFKFYA